MIRTKLFLYLAFGVLLLTACQSEDDEEEKENPMPENSVFTIEPEAVTLAVGESCQLVAKLNGVPLDNDMVRWGTNTSMISVDKGKVTVVFYNDFISELFVNAKKGEEFYAKCKISVYQEYYYKFRLTLKDKGVADYSMSQPEKFLSAKAIERRNKKNIAIDESVCPFPKPILSRLKK